MLRPNRCDFGVGVVVRITRTVWLLALVAPITFGLSRSVAIANEALPADPDIAQAPGLFAGGKLLATGGVSQVEGAGGGGITPWAMITGNETGSGIGANIHVTGIVVDDFNLQSAGLAVGLFDHLELSYARQVFDTQSAGAALGLGKGYTFGQDVWGAKLRLAGDAVYGQDTWLPQVSVGVQYKSADRAAVLSAIGARNHKGVDYYLSATKIILTDSLLVNATLRLTKANQTGLLGFGGDRDDDYSFEGEGSLAYLVSRNVVVGVEYRMKPDNLHFAREEDWADAFIAWFPSKNFSATLAYADIGDVATRRDQRGLYLSLQTGF